jgi:hypothetical protein
MNMNSKSKIVPFVIGLSLTFSAALPALAARSTLTPETTTAVKTAVKADTTVSKDATKITDLQTKAGKEIDRRIAALNQLSARIASMKKTTDAQKAALTTTIEDQITTLSALDAKIQAETDLATLKTDIQSITKSYRIFLLVLPQGSITAAGDRALSLVDSMTAIATKLETRIATAKTAGSDVSVLEASLADYNAKLADAKTQVQAAIDAISKLTPDGGDKTKMAANQAALKAAHAKIQSAQKDFVAARKDAKDITQTLKGSIKTKATTSTDTSE